MSNQKYLPWKTNIDNDDGFQREGRIFIQSWMSAEGAGDTCIPEHDDVVLLNFLGADVERWPVLLGIWNFKSCDIVLDPKCPLTRWDQIRNDKIRKGELG